MQTLLPNERKEELSPVRGSAVSGNGKRPAMFRMTSVPAKKNDAVKAGNSSRIEKLVG